MVDLRMVRVVLRQVARDRRTGWGRVSFGREDIRTRPKGINEDIPVRIKLSAWSILGAQGKQGTQLAVAPSEWV